MLIFKIVTDAQWREAEATGEFKGAPIDLQDGYLHFSTGPQCRETAALYFADQSDLLLVAVEADGLGEALRWEASRGGALFPHLFRTLQLSEVAWVAPLPLGADGAHQFPDRFLQSE
ncbi:MAG: DUF952 domain-containing protein [Pseudomonadota bacterium]